VLFDDPIEFFAPSPRRLYELPGVGINVAAFRHDVVRRDVADVCCVEDLDRRYTCGSPGHLRTARA
jgi:hypothetical protein